MRSVEVEVEGCVATTTTTFPSEGTLRRELAGEGMAVMGICITMRVCQVGQSCFELWRGSVLLRGVGEAREVERRFSGLLALTGAGWTLTSCTDGGEGYPSARCVEQLRLVEAEQSNEWEKRHYLRGSAQQLCGPRPV